MALLTDAHGATIPNWGPASQIVAIDPDDVTDLTTSRIRGLWIGTGGNVAVMGLNDTVAVTIMNVADGTLLPLMVKKVMETNTTASNIVGWG